MVVPLGPAGQAPALTAGLGSSGMEGLGAMTPQAARRLALQLRRGGPVACGRPCGLDEADASTRGKKIVLAASARLGISEADKGGVTGARATDFAQTQQALTPSI